MTRRLLPILLAWILAASVSISVSSVVAHTLTIGRATDKVTKEHRRLHPIVTYLAERLQNDGITGGRVVLEGNNNDQGIIDFLDSGDLDLVFESPFSAALYRKRCGARPIALVCREGLVVYRSLILVRFDSPIQTPADLIGQVIAFEDPTSTSAYHLPKRSLQDLGYTLAPVRLGDRMSGDRIGYVFAGSELNLSSWVFFGKVAAGCLSSADWVNPEENPTAFRESFRIIHETQPIPRMVVMARKGLAPELAERIRTEMLAMHEDPGGKAALAPYRIDYFTELTPEAETLIETLSSESK